MIAAVVDEDQEDERIVQKSQRRRPVKASREPSAAQKADIQNKILAALVKKGLVSEEKLLEEGFMSEEVQELASHKQEGIPDEVLDDTKWKISVPEVSDPEVNIPEVSDPEVNIPEVSDPEVNVPAPNTESSIGPDFDFVHKHLTEETVKVGVETKTRAKKIKNRNKNGTNLEGTTTKVLAETKAEKGINGNKPQNKLHGKKFSGNNKY